MGNFSCNKCELFLEQILACQFPHISENVEISQKFHIVQWTECYFFIIVKN